MDEKPNLEPALKKMYSNLFLLLGLGTVVFLGVVLYAILGHTLDFSSDKAQASTEAPKALAVTEVAEEEIIDGIHTPTGLKVAEGFEIVRAQCTACHSGKLVAQNRATRTGWQEMIRWMQDSQGLWPLGENEPIILNYLATNYGPEETGRRANIKEVEWYILDLGD
jgi:cytochrome c5